MGAVPIVGGAYGAYNSTTWGGVAVESGLELTEPLDDAVKGGTRLAKTVVKAADVPIVVDQRLSQVVSDLYKGVANPNPNRFGDGSTMDAMKYELATGDKVFGRDHVAKGQEALRSLQHWSANPSGGTLASDKFAAEDLIGQLRAILGYQ